MFWYVSPFKLRTHYLIKVINPTGIKVAMIQSALNCSQLTAFMDSIETLQPSTENLDKFTKLSKKMFFFGMFYNRFS